MRDLTPKLGAFAMVVQPRSSWEGRIVDVVGEAQTPGGARIFEVYFGDTEETAHFYSWELIRNYLARKADEEEGL